MNPFKGRHFQRDIILWAVRWYCKYGISYRELQEMLAERGVNVDHSTIYRWVQRYAPEMEKRLRWYWRNPSDLCPWHMDETYVKVNGRWAYLYRAVDSRGRTVDFYLSSRRNSKAAYRFLGKSKLNVLGIRTALDLALTNPAFIRKNFSVVLERTVRELNGESCMSLEEAPPTKQQIVCSRSFGEKITEYDSLRQAVCQYAERASEKLRKERQYCRHISVFIKTSPFAVKEPYYGNVATEKLLTPTQDTRDIIAAATTALERIWKDGHLYAKAGVMLNDFTGSGVSQLQLFDERPPRPHSSELMKVLDGINHSGLGQIWFAGRGIAPSWQMKRDMLSPAYTTRWKDIPVARIR